MLLLQPNATHLLLGAISCVFSTKERRKTVHAEVQERLWTYVGGIAREIGATAIAVGGTDDHVHLLLSLPSTLTVADAMRKIKSGSSRFLHDSCAMPRFEWQEGYGAFSIGQAQIEVTQQYIARQKEPHEKFGFEAEFQAILRSTVLHSM